MKGVFHIVVVKTSFFSLCLAACFAFTGKNNFSVNPATGYVNLTDSVPKTDETPPPRKGLRKYIHILTDKQQRDSLMKKLSRESEPLPVSDSLARAIRQNTFSPFRGKIIRNIYYNRLNVFGTIIDDPTYSSSNKLVKFANKLHLNTKEWMIRQSLFFRENDTVNVYKMVENERYLRNLAFIQDASFYIINTYQDPDSVDLMVNTKDLFEYGGTLGGLSPTAVAASIYNNNLAGAGQNILLGFRWEDAYRPQWRGEISYTKYNLGGSFADVSIGYSALNDRSAIDTGVYERSFFLSVNRPLYSSWAKLTGGFNFYYNQSMNIFSYSDSIYRDYQYKVFDVWGGYNFRTQFKNNGIISNLPNLAVELRHYNLHYVQKPVQPQFAMDPVYNDHNYALARFVLFKQDFFKTNYFFGFGRTEDIPMGYNLSTTFGIDNWVGFNRTYTALEGQKYFLSKKENLYSASLGLGSFWESGSQDAVIHLQSNYYSHLFRWKKEKFRQFVSADYLYCPNPSLYKPLNINRGNGIFGYRHTTLNGYARFNMSFTTDYYSRISLYGFRFNFFTLIQASLLEDPHTSIFRSPLYSGLGLGFAVRNESLTFNTIQFSASYLPRTPGGTSSYFAEITTTAALNFNIFALQTPAFISFR